jgi:hypothetical protein
MCYYIQVNYFLETGSKVSNSKPEYENNPFYPELNCVLTTELVGAEKRVADIMRYDGETGEILDDELTEIKEVVWRMTHKTKFIKLMADSVHKLAKLNSAGNKLFWLLAGSVSQESHNKDYAYLGLEHCKSMAKSVGISLSKTTYYKGIDSLIDCHVIAKSTRSNMFWLNISILFNGNFSQLPMIKQRDTLRRKLESEGRNITWQESV